MRVEISPLAERDLEAIGDFIADDNPLRAVSFVAELRMQCAEISKAPLACHARPELGEGIRSCAYGNYVIRIVRVLHGAMDIAAQFGDTQE